MTAFCLPGVLNRDAANEQLYAVFLNVIEPVVWLNGYNNPDSNGIIPYYFPYPSTGLSLGLIAGDASIEPQSTLTDGLSVANTGVSLAQDSRLSGYKRIIEFTTWASRRPLVRNLTLDPGARSDVSCGGGGEIYPTVYDNILMLIVDLQSARNNGICTQFTAIYNYNIIIETAIKETFNSQPKQVSWRCHAYCGTDSTGNPIKRLWRRDSIDNYGNLMNFNDPNNPIVPNMNANYTAWPVLNMQSGMM